MELRSTLDVRETRKGDRALLWLSSSGVVLEQR